MALNSGKKGLSSIMTGVLHFSVASYDPSEKVRCLNIEVCSDISSLLSLPGLFGIEFFLVCLKLEFFGLSNTCSN